MKILFASMPADGHFNPLTGVAVDLAERGHDVRWYAGPDVRRQAGPTRHAVVPLPAGHRGHGRQPRRAVPRAGRAQGPQADLLRPGQVLREPGREPLPGHRRDPGGVAVRGAGLRRRSVRRAAGRRVPARAGVRRRPDDGDARRERPTAVLRAASRAHARGPAAPRDRAQDAGQRHEGRHDSLQRDPGQARRRTDPPRRLPARTDAQDASGLPQRLARAGVPGLPAAPQRRVRRPARPGPSCAERLAPRCPTSSPTRRRGSSPSPKARWTTPIRTS